MKVHHSVDSLRQALPAAGRPPAVVVGLCSHGLAILRSLSRKGVPVLAIESNWDQPSAQPRHGFKLHHDGRYGESLVRLLLDWGRPYREAVLFVTNDKMVAALEPGEEATAAVHLPFPGRSFSRFAPGGRS